MVLVGVALLGASCRNSATSPTTTRTPAAPTTAESFIGSLGVGSSRFYSFSVLQYGTVNITLNSTTGAADPGDVALGLGLGNPSGTGCATPTTLTASAGTTAQVTGVVEVGVYCARIYDVGNLAGAVTFNVSIAHP